MLLLKYFNLICSVFNFFFSPNFNRKHARVFFYVFISVSILQQWLHPNLWHYLNIIMLSCQLTHICKISSKICFVYTFLYFQFCHRNTFEYSMPWLKHQADIAVIFRCFQSNFVKPPKRKRGAHIPVNIKL